MGDSTKNETYERMLIETLLRIKRYPGTIIGEPSLVKLYFFISGYEYAFMELTQYCFHFDRDFQSYVLSLFPTKETVHWHRIIAKGHTDTEAFEIFYEIFDAFCKR